MDIKKEIERLTVLKDNAYPNYPVVIQYEKQIRVLKAQLLQEARPCSRA